MIILCVGKIHWMVWIVLFCSKCQWFYVSLSGSYIRKKKKNSSPLLYSFIARSKSILEILSVTVRLLKFNSVRGCLFLSMYCFAFSLILLYLLPFMNCRGDLAETVHWLTFLTQVIHDECFWQWVSWWMLICLRMSFHFFTFFFWFIILNNNAFCRHIFGGGI